MKKRDYFLAAMRDECYRHRSWVYDAFSFQEEAKQEPVTDHPWPLWRTAQGYFFKNMVTGNVEMLEGTLEDEPAFDFLEEIDLKKGDIISLKEDVKTTYGNVLYNYITLVYSVGDKIPFQAGEIKPGALEKFFFTMESVPPEGTTRDPKKIYVDEYLKFQEAIRFTEEFAILCVPAATPINVVTDPRIPEVRAKLIAEAVKSGKINDPAEEARITEELVKMDRAWVENDPEKGFYTKDKSFNITRKKMYVIQGTESGFDASPDASIIETSLEDGWDISRLPEMNNSLRNGSFSRGAMTALGGEIVKTLLRITQNTSITEDDCKANHGLPVTMTKEEAKKYVDRYYIGPNKKPIYIDDAVAESLVGKTVEIRSPWSCQTDGYNVCRTCMGKALGETPKAISVYVSDVGSAFLLTFLALMHGQSKIARKYSFKDRIS